VVHQNAVSFEVGRALQMSDGSDVTLISTGGMLATSVAVADCLTEVGLACRVLSMHTVKPLDTGAVLKAATQTRLVVTLEEHSVTGGLGGAVAEVMAEHPSAAPLKRIGLPSTFASRAGSRDYLLEEHGLSAGAIAETVQAVWQNAVRTSAKAV
jgi:transketolase